MALGNGLDGPGSIPGVGGLKIFLQSFASRLVVVVVLGFTTLLTSEVISVAFYSEREMSGKFCSEALISASGSFTCRKSTRRDPRLYFPSDGSHSGFLRSEKIHRPRPGLNPRTSDPVASMITMRPPGSIPDWSWESTQPPIK